MRSALVDGQTDQIRPFWLPAALLCPALRIARALPSATAASTLQAASPA